MKIFCNLDKKTIIISNKQQRKINETVTLNEVIDNINQTINEEYGINDEVHLLANRIGNEIRTKIQEAIPEHTNIEGLIYREKQITFTSTDSLFINSEKINNNFKDFKLTINIHNYNFKNYYFYNNFIETNGNIVIDSTTGFNSIKNFKAIGLINFNYISVSGKVKNNFYSDLYHELSHYFQQLNNGERYNNSQYMVDINTKLSSNDENIKNIATIIYYCDNSEQDSVINGLYGYAINDDMKKSLDINNIDNIIKNDTSFKWSVKLHSLILWLKNNINSKEINDIIKNDFNFTSIKSLINYAEKQEKRLNKKITKCIFKIKKDAGLIEGFGIKKESIFCHLSKDNYLINEITNNINSDINIQIQKNNTDYVNEVIDNINQAINEEYGISRIAIKIGDMIKDKILNNKDNVKITPIEKGINKREFNFKQILPSDIKDIKNDFNNNEKLNNKTINIHFHISNINFVNKQMYEDYIKKNGDIDLSSITGYNSVGNNNLSITNFTYISISGKPLNTFYSDLQHEISHIYQQLNAGKRYSNFKQMFKVNNNLYNEDEIIKKISTLLYHCDNAEQDAAINGVYNLIINNKDKDFEEIDNLIKNDTSFKWLINDEETISFLEKTDLSSYKKLLIQKLNIHDVDKLIIYAKKQLKRFYNKFGKSVMKAKQDAKITENIIYENTSLLFQLLPLNEEIYKPSELLIETKTYNVNMEEKLINKDGRTTIKTTPKQLEDKIKELWKINRSNEEYRNFKSAIHQLMSYPKGNKGLNQYSKDISKVKFDGENFEVIGDIRTNSNGISYIIAESNGDWEIPLLIFIYYDGKDIRGYIPTYGNTFDRKRKIAFGNDDKSDYEFIDNEFKDDKNVASPYDIRNHLKFNIDACIKDFNKHIKLSK